ncbi:hypothetical protein [uncultured Paraglaciecola sp.]|uniref:hypothetical protein n=1 Tax=uncultured Paraglaciecola sp. TaxID=1765024 RepID=UPI00260E3B23|nr:hypothetical protein [uncultured Paraglaciecola sp.]
MNEREQVLKCSKGGFSETCNVAGCTLQLDKSPRVTLMIVSFKSKKLETLWMTGDLTLLPSTYAWEVAEILDLLNAVTVVKDLELLGGFILDEYKPNQWAVTVTVNNVEPIGSVTCHYFDGRASEVDLNEFS